MGDFNSKKINKVNFGTYIQELPKREIGKEGLRKKILQKGNSWKTPFPGDEIQVHYGVKLQDGEYFDSSYDKGKPFTFKLGQGEVIKGWDEGIATMKKSERAIFTIPPNLGYGEIGSPPLIPPNSTLIFEIELVSWNSIRDISGDGGISKKIIKEGEGWATPKDVDEVLGHLYPAMKKCIKTMRKGEIVELTVKPAYYFGNSSFDGDGIGILQSNSNLIIHLELISWKIVVDVTGDNKVLKKLIKVGEGYDHPIEGSLAKVMYIGKHEDGTVFERKGSVEEPFDYASKFIQFDHSFNSHERSRANALRLSCYLNNGGHQEASKMCSKVIEYDPCNVKALFRRAQAYLRINELEKAEIDIKKALQVDPNNRDVKVMYKEVKNKQKQYAQHEVKIFSTMLSRLA
ncbi:Peptidyl-prolyl cis-trans isomerase FKBP65 [Capsicum annuum]|nr:Peptidyl-prolyl cis-trans isomerase FKBP65 [Capsicum annuum]